MTASGTDPTLTAAEITRLLAIAARVDTDDLAPGDDGWTGTWDLRFAAAEGWRWKAGKVSERVGMNVDGDAVQRQHLYKHCMDMAKGYATGVVGTIQVGEDV
jgi:hypothetical protein